MIANQDDNNDTIILMHCLFEKTGQTEFYSHVHPIDDVSRFPNCYSILIAFRTSAGRDIKAGIVVKTHYNHKQSDFGTKLRQLIRQNKYLDKFAHRKVVTFLPAWINSRLNQPPSNRQMLRILSNQASKRSNVAWRNK